MDKTKKRIVILGGGFGGIYTGMYLERLIKSKEWEIVIINRENYFVYQPMLSEVVGGTLGILDTVSAIRNLIPKCQLIIREIEEVDLEKKEVIISPNFSRNLEKIKYDHLVFALGNVTDFQNEVGLHEHAFPFKNLADSLKIRNHLIDVIETANVTKDPELKKRLLTFVVGGGGFSGTEIVAEISDFTKKMSAAYPHIHLNEIRVILVHSKTRLMEKELSFSLSQYVEKLLKAKGVELLLEEKLISATPQSAILKSGKKIDTHTVISTVPASMNPILEKLDLPKKWGKITTTKEMLVEGSNHLWALGDCASIPLNERESCPSTAQFAIRQAKTLAKNIWATLEGKKRKPFYFKSLGMLGALGHYSAFAELFGCIRLSGLLAWFLWRAVYWIKLPGTFRKIKVIFSWLLDGMFPAETVQIKIAPSQGVATFHFEKGDVIFKEGEIGDYLYIIIEGRVEVLRGGKKLAELEKGEFFGEIALLSQKERTATVKCLEKTNVLALRKSDFGALTSNIQELKAAFQKAEEKRK